MTIQPAGNGGYRVHAAHRGGEAVRARLRGDRRADDRHAVSVGGRTRVGIDCSALVQISLDAAGVPCPRDSDMQEAEIGEAMRSRRGSKICGVGISCSGRVTSASWRTA